MIKKKYDKKKGTNNMYLDAAIEALEQACKEDKELSHFLLLAKDGKMIVSHSGEEMELSKAMAHVCFKDEFFRTIVLAASDCIHIMLGDKHLTNLEKFVDKMEAFNKKLEELTKDLGGLDNETDRTTRTQDRQGED